MPKKSSIWLIAILSLLLPLATACGTLSSTGSVSNVSTHGNLYVLAGPSNQGASSSSLRIVSLQAGNANPGVQLPNGLTSLDHQRLYTAVAQHGQTTISVINTQDASIIRSFSIPGTYATAGTLFDHAVLSFDGHWLALRSLATDVSQTTIALLDTQAGKLTRTIQLNGDFDLDAVNPDASRIYLLERLHDGTSHYYVRLYQVNDSQLVSSLIVDKSEINGSQMNGTALVRQVAADGSKIFTLYIDPYHNIAFIHILPLTGDYLGARCIDLQTGKDPSLLHYYTLALHTNLDGSSTLYAANGALGMVTAVNITADDEVFNININAVAHFTPAQTNVNPTTRSRLLYNGAVLSPDGQTLFFAGLQGIWYVRTGDLSGKHSTFNSYLLNHAFTSLGLSPDGITLYAVDPTQGIMTLDPSTGQTGQILQAPVKAPWGIEWIEH